jgi:hypothetical protein
VLEEGAARTGVLPLAVTLIHRERADLTTLGFCCATRMLTRGASCKASAPGPSVQRDSSKPLLESAAQRASSSLRTSASKARASSMTSKAYSRPMKSVWAATDRLLRRRCHSAELVGKDQK